MKSLRKFTVTAWIVLAAASSAGAAGWRTILQDDFNTDPSANWSYAGRQNGASQNLVRWDGSGRLLAEWDQFNQFDGNTDPQVIEPSSFTRPLGRTLTDADTFKFGATLRIDAVADTTEMFQVANFGLYNPVQMGPDRAMSDNWSGNAQLVRDGSDFVEFLYFINTGWGGPTTQATIGAHIEGSDGNYVTGWHTDPMYHATLMGADGHLPTGSELYVEVTYRADLRRAYSAIYTDPGRTQLLTVYNSELRQDVPQFYWTLPMAAGDHFTLTHAGFWNYVGGYWGDVAGAGSGAFDDLYVAYGVLPGDADANGTVEFSDYQLLESNFGLSTGAAWEQGDFDGDGDVDFTDYQLLESNFGESLPEPGTLAILTIGAAVRFRRR